MDARALIYNFTGRNVMKYFILWVLILGGCQSSHEQKVPRFDKKSLETHFRTRNLNVLVMWDQRIIGLDDENTFAVALKSFLKEFLNNYRARIVVSGLDGNPPYFFLSSNSNNLPVITPHFFIASSDWI